MNRITNTRRSVIASAAFATLATSAYADTFQWTNPVNGTWPEAAKWTKVSGTGSAPPGVGDTAIFSASTNGSTSYSVGLTGNVSIDALTATARYGSIGSAIGGPRRTLNITTGAADFTLNNEAYFWVGTAQNEPGLNVNVGDATSVNNGAYLYIGQSQFSTERLLLGTTGGTLADPSRLTVGSAATLGVNTTQATTIGTAGSGWLEVYGNAMFNGELRVGRSSIADQAGYVTLEDGTLWAPSLSIGGGAASTSFGSVWVKSNAEMLLTNSLTVGGAAGTGAATFEVTSGRFLSPQTTTIINPTGRMTIQNAQDTFFRSDLNVNGGQLWFRGNSQDITFDPGVDITVRPGGLLAISGSLTLPAASNVVQPGGSYAHYDDFASGPEVVTIPSGGTLTLNGGADMRGDTVVRGTLNYNPTSYQSDSNTSFFVQDGGQFNATQQWTPRTGGTLSVSGSGSIHRDLAATSFVFGESAGWSSGARATTRVEAGGTFQKDTGAIEIGRYGTLQVAGGTLVADDITKQHADAQFEFTGGHIIIDNPLPIGSWSPMPGDMNLGNGKTLQTLSTATIEPSRLLHLTGGELRAHSIVNSGAMQLDSGTLALAGGTYTGPAVTIGVNAVLAGTGSFAARINGAGGSRIIAEGDLSLGDATNAAGFATAGDIATGAHTVTLRDSNAAVLGALNQIGDANAPGSLAAPNGMLLPTGSSMAGYGTVSTPSDPTKAFVADGAVAGESGARHLTLAGHVKGTGTFDRVTFAGTFDPGNNGPARIVTGDLRFDTSAALKIELGGAALGSGFDQIDATGFGVELGGTLELSMLNNYQPAMLVPHAIILADGFAGRFDAISGVNVAPGLALAVTYDDERVSVTAARPGDANLDGSVNLDDFNLLASSFGTLSGALWQSGDFTGDGSVGLDDFNLLASNFNLSAGADGVVNPEDWSTLGASVPEPSAFLSTIAAGTAMLMPRRRRKNI